MAEASFHVLDKAEKQLDLTSEERRAASDHRIWILADRAFHRGREAFVASNFRGAIEHLREANHFFGSWKIGAVLMCLRTGPTLLRRAYDWRSRMQVKRIRRRSEQALARLATARFVGLPAARHWQGSGVEASKAAFRVE